MFRMLVGQLVLGYEIMFLQHQHGVIDEDFWRRRQMALGALLSQPGVRQWWARGVNVRRVYDSGFHDLVESLLGNVTTQTSPPADKGS